MCPQARSHLEVAAERVLGAASAYIGTKYNHNNTEAKCEEAGIAYQPIIFESLGGAADETVRVLNSISSLVADNTNASRGEVAQRLWERISIDLQRAGHRAFARRAGGSAGLGRSQAEGLLEATEGLMYYGTG